MWEVIRLPDRDKHSGWELMQDVEERISGEQSTSRFKVERVFTLWKLLPIFLQPEDFSKMVQELAYDRDPEAFEDHESEPLLKRVEEATNIIAPVKEAA